MDTLTWPYISRSESDTHALGIALGEQLRGGAVLALSGDLGAGKTRLAQGIAEGLGVPDDDPVVSPTYALMHTYDGRDGLRFIHMDLYRLDGPSGAIALGLEDVLGASDTVSVVEWAERAPEVMPVDTVWLEMRVLTDGHREVRLGRPDSV